MSEAMEGPKVFGKAGGLFDAVHLLIDIVPLPTPTSREDIRAAGAGVIGQQVLGRRIEGDFLIDATLGAPASCQ